VDRVTTILEESFKQQLYPFIDAKSLKEQKQKKKAIQTNERILDAT